MGDILDEIKARENAVKVVVLLGESGVGKSSIGNCLLSLYSVEGFAMSRMMDSCTETTSERSVALITNRAKCAIIDTIGQCYIMADMLNLKKWGAGSLVGRDGY